MSPRELERRAKHKPAVLRHVEEVSGNISATCRYYGICRQCYYTWRRRFDEDGFDGLKDRSSVPRHQPTKTDPEIIEKILWPTAAVPLRTPRISMCLRRYHDIEISLSSIWRILHKIGLNGLSASQRYQRTQTRWKRYEKQRPGHQLQVEVKFIESLGQTEKGKRYYLLRGDRRLHAPADTACVPAERSPDRDSVHRPRVVETAVPDRASADGQRARIRLGLSLAPARQGHRTREDPPRTSRLHGKVERSHGIDSDEFYRLLEGEVIDDAKLFAERLRQREGHYNYDRPHGALSGQTPYERLRQKARDPLS
jgi:transposase